MKIGIVLRREADEAQDFAQSLARRMAGQDHVGHGERAGVDERIAGHAAFLFELDDGVEGVAGRLAADAPPQMVAGHAQRQSQREHFRYALDGKGNVRIAATGDGPVGSDHRKAEPARIDAGEFGNIGRDGAAVGAARHFLSDVAHDAFQIRQFCFSRAGSGASHPSAG